jgi:hypothetical protein
MPSLFRRSRVLTSTLAIVIAAAVRAHATLVVPADLGELSRDARAIARGRVTSVEGRWTDDRRTIETIVTLEVESYLKGSLGSTLQFRVPGGDLGRFRSVVVGAPEFAVDQRVIVFLGASGPMVPYVLGLNQGVYRLVPGSDRATTLVMPPAMLPAASVSTPVVRGDVNRRPLALSDFEQRVRALVGAAR